MTTNTTPAPIGADARSRFIAWAAAFFPDDGLARAARAWEENSATAVAWRAALASAAQPTVSHTTLARELRLLANIQDEVYPNFRAVLLEAADALEAAPKAAPAPAAVAGPSDEMVLAAARIMSPSLFLHGLEPLPKDGPNTALRMRQEAALARCMLDAAFAAAPTTQASPAAQVDALDTERLDWLTFNISGKALRDIGVIWSEHSDARRAIDVARAAKEGSSHAR